MRIEIFQLILIQVITFIGIILALRAILYHHARQSLNRLQRLYQETLEKEEVLKEEIEGTKRMRQEEIDKAKKEAGEIIQESKKGSQEKAQEIIASAEKEAKKILEKSTKQLEGEKREIATSMEKKAVGWIEKTIGHILSSRTKLKFHQDLMDELIEEFEKSKDNWIKDTASIDKIEVLSAYPLERVQKEKIAKFFLDYLKRDIDFRFNTDENLIGGLIIDLKGKVIDGSLKNRISQALKIVKASQT